MVVLEHLPYRLIRIEPEHVDAVLPVVRPLLERAVPYTAGHVTLEELLATMRQGARPWQFWVVVNGAEACGGFITSLERVGVDLVCTFELLAGIEAQAWIAPLIHRFERYMAFMYGVTSMRIVGRRGWERFLAQHGYGASHIVTTKRILPAVADLREFLPRRAS